MIHLSVLVNVSSKILNGKEVIIVVRIELDSFIELSNLHLVQQLENINTDGEVTRLLR